MPGSTHESKVTILIAKDEVLIATDLESRLEGLGYPTSGKDISVHGCVCAVAGVFDVLTGKRPYKEAFSEESMLKSPAI